MNQHSSALGRLGRASVVYGLGSVVGRAASMVMLPVYTRLLTPGDYGILQMLDLTVDVVSILLSAGATSGVMRFYYKSEDDGERRAILGSAVVLLTALNALGGLLMAIAAPVVITHLLGPTATPTMVYLSAANFAVGALSVVPMLLLQMQERAVLFTMLNVGRLLVQLTMNIVLLVVFRLGPTGILVSGLVASTLMAVVAGAFLLRAERLRVTWDAIRRLHGFAVPYQLTMGGAFVLTFGNRYFIKRYFGIEEVGIYGLAFQFGFILASLTSAPILRAWTPQRHQAAKLPRAERDALYNRGLVFLSAITIGGATGVALFVEPVLRIMSDPAFHGAALVVPVVVLAFVLQAWSDTFTFNFDVGERPSCITIGTWATVAVSLVLFVSFVPRWGVMGAAASTAVAFAIRLGIFWGWSTRVWPVSIAWRPHALLLGSSALAYLGFRLWRPAGLLPQVGAASVALAVFVVLGWLASPADLRGQLRARAAALALRLPGMRVR